MQRQKSEYSTLSSYWMPTSHAAAPSLSTSCSALQTQLPAHVSQQVLDDGPNAWVPAAHLRETDGVPASLLQLDSPSDD